jgi:hypothetical protein
MQAASEWTENLASKKVKVTETSLFEGRPQRVLVVFLNFFPPAVFARLSARGIDREETSARFGQDTQCLGAAVESYLFR